MAGVSLKKDFKDGDKLFGQQLNNNFGAIEAALNAMNKIVWQDDPDDTVVTFRGTTEEINSRAIIDGQLLYDTSTGETYIDYGSQRISTGSGNAIFIGENEPTNPATQLWIDPTEMLNVIGSEIERGSNENGSWIKYSDGTLIQYNDILVTDQAISTEYKANTLFFGTRNIYFPITFSASAYVAICGTFRWGTGGSWGAVMEKIDRSAMKLIGYDAFSRDAGTSCRISWMAIGRWK